MTICIAGKNEIAVNGLQYLIQNLSSNKHRIVAVGNDTDDGVNSWQPSYKFFCMKNKIELLNLDDLYEEDDLIFISLEHNKLLRPNKFKSKKLFNIHFSLLPAYKGMFTSVMPLLNGEKVSGVTLHYIDNGIDTGDIIDQISFSLSHDLTARDLYQLYLKNGFQLFKKNAEQLVSGEIHATWQPAYSSSYYSKTVVDFKNIQIDLNKTAWEIHNQIRAFTFRDYQLPTINAVPVYKSEILNEKSIQRPGIIIEETPYWFKISSIDYNVKIYKDQEEKLFLASKSGDLDLWEDLKKNGYPLDTRNKKGWDALIVSAYHGRTLFAKYLIEGGWNINSSNYKGTSVLMYAMDFASRSNDLEILKVLMAYQPNLDHKDDTGKTVLQYAIEYGNNNVIEFLKSRNE